MNMDRESIRKPQTWAVLVPVILSIWVLASLIAMNRAQAACKEQERETNTAQGYARDILAMMAEIGEDNLPGARSGEFDPIASVRACAEAAFIRESKLSKGESFKPKEQADGNLLIRESYRINGIRLLQIARFIDHAEGDYSSVTCTQLNLTHARSKQKDAWDATLDIQYVTH
ncbi:MAG: hypothetical protein ACTSX7_08630 [Alphaproteobacteria bacterium]